MSPELAEVRKEYHKKWYDLNAERTKTELREKYKLNKGLYNKRCREYRERYPERTVLRRIKQRCSKEHIEFNLTEEDIVIPEVCPALNIPLVMNTGVQNDNSVSVDRIDPSKGYVKGNIQIISFLANRIKSNATKEQVMKVAEWMI